MPEFKNMSQLANYIRQKQGNTVVGKGQTLQIVLSKELLDLERYVQEEIDEYYNDEMLKPTHYVRTYNWQKSIRVSPITQQGTTMSATIYFDRDMAYHESIFNDPENSKYYPAGYVPWLMEVGWNWSPEKPRRGKVSDFDGIQYIKKAVDRFNRENKSGFKITVYHNGEYYYGDRG